jgi:hypothetical protein
LLTPQWRFGPAAARKAASFALVVAAKLPQPEQYNGFPALPEPVLSIVEGAIPT